MATKAQVEELERQIRDLKWELKDKETEVQEILKKKDNEHIDEINELKKNLMPMTRQDVIDLIRNNLSISIKGDYGGYVTANVMFMGEIICDDTTQVTTDFNPLDE